MGIGDLVIPFGIAELESPPVREAASTTGESTGRQGCMAQKDPPQNCICAFIIEEGATLQRYTI